MAATGTATRLPSCITSQTGQYSPEGRSLIQWKSCASGCPTWCGSMGAADKQDGDGGNQPDDVAAATGEKQPAPGAGPDQGTVPEAATATGDVSGCGLRQLFFCRHTTYVSAPSGIWMP